MPIHAITAVGEPGHITAADDGLCHAAIVGTDSYIMAGIGSECDMQAVDANTIRISDGLMCLQGRWVNFVNATDVYVESGTLGQYRRDIIYVHRHVGDGNMDVYELRVSRGTAAQSIDAATPTPPQFVDNGFLEGSDDVDIPICEVRFDGITPSARHLVAIKHASSADNVTASGTSGNWRFMKYESGIAICWYSGTVSNAAITYPSGSIFRTQNPNSVSFPFEFATNPVTSVTISSTTGGVFGAKRSAISKTELSFTIYSSASNTASPLVQIIACGRWK